MQLKKVLAIVLSVVMIIGVMPFAAFAESSEQLETSVASITVGEVTTYYDTLAEAVAAVPENGEAATSIKLLADVTVTSTINITNGKMVKIAGSSKTITANGVDPMFHIEGASLEFTGKCTVQSTSLDCTVFRLVGLKDAAAQYSSLITASSTTVKSEEYGILVRNNNGYADGVYIKIGGVIESGVACIYTNGNIQKYGANPATILVSGSSSKLTCTNNLNNSSKDNAAVYAAGYADWTFGAGSVSGPTALYAKCGNFVLRGTSFTGKGEKVAYAHNGNGITATGAAVVFETSAGYCDDLTVSITKGIYNSVNSDPIESYAYSTANDAREPVTGFVSAGASFRKNGVATDVSEFYTAELAAKFEAGTAYIQSAEFGGTEGYISDTAPLAKVTRNGKDYYVGNVFGAANKCVAGETVYALGDFTSTSQLVLSTSGVTIDLQGYTVNSNNSFYPIRVKEGADITIKNGTINSTANSYGLSMCKDSTITLADDVTLNGNITNYLSSDTGATANVYGEVNGTIQPSTDDSTVNVYEGATVTAATAINPSKGTVNVSGGTINGAVTKAAAASVVISGGTFSQGGEPLDVSAYLAEGATEDANGVVAQTYVAKVGDDLYDTLAAAIVAASAGDTVKLLGDATVNTGSASNSRYAISKSLTIDGDNHTISINNRGFGVGMDATAPVDVTFKDVTIINSTAAGRCVDTRGNLNSLTLDNATLKTTGTSGYLQPLTIGGNQASTATVNVINSTIQTSDDGSKGYAIITFNPVDMTITNSTIKGWACIYAKGVDGSAGSAGSTFTVSGSTLVSKNPHSGATNAFGTLVVEDSDIDFNITNCNISIDGEANEQYLFTNNVEYLKDYVDPDAEIENVTVALGEGNNVELKAMGEFAIDATDDVTLVISGGTFSAPVPVEYCAQSYRANYDDEAGAYVVEQQVAPNNGANITVKDSISANFYIDEHYYPAGAVAVKEYNANTNVSETPNVVTETVALSSLERLHDGSAYDGDAIISIEQAPAQITEDIVIKVYANAADAAAETNALKEITYSTRDYCETILAGDYTQQEKDLAAATLDYGRAAQLYFGYNTDDMAADSFYGAVEEANLSAYRGFYEKAYSFKFVTITAKSDLEINFLSNVDFDVTDYSIGTESGVQRFAVANTGENGDYYVANISGLVPANFDEIIRIETSEGNLEFTANTVLEVISRSSNANYATLAKAMFLYGVAANAYFG